METANRLVRLETRDRVATLTLASPPLNILTAAMMGEICDAVEVVAADPEVVALAFTAEGKAFSAGADVGEHEPERAPEMIATFERMFALLSALEIPVVMAVDGAALGGGFELVMMADILLASERAKFGQPEIRLAFIAPVGVALLPELVGVRRAMEITCTGDTYDAATMYDWGFVSKVVPAEELDAALEAVLKSLRRSSPLVMRLNTRTLKAVRGSPWEAARQEAERVFLEEVVTTEDVREGIASFYERRRPVWKNR